MYYQRSLFFLGAVLFIAVGCATAEDPGARSLARQQSATIESLRAEVVRLNEELDGVPGLRKELRAALPKLEQSLAAQIARGDVRVVLEKRGLVVTVLDHALFDPDGSQFTPAGEEVLDKVAAVLSEDLPKNRVMLEGNTDNQPVENADGITNWEYSIGRATAALHYFIDVRGLDPARLGVAGYAEYRPVTSNATEEGRDRNRRIEIVIAPERGSHVADNL